MASSYDKIIELIKKLDINDDGIKMNQKIKAIETDFFDTVFNEDVLIELMEYLNDTVLKDLDGNTAQNFAVLMTTRNLDMFAMNDTVVRYKMVSLLQKNFIKSEEYSKNNKNMLYNSITLLGEYYHRIRHSDGSLMSDLGSALLEMLTKEIVDESNSESKSINVKLAKLILSQITLNGKLLQISHKNQLNSLLFHIRRILIELDDIKSYVKALLLMTLDLFYNNFCNLGTQLEEMYTKYLIEAEKFENDTIIKEEQKIKNDDLDSKDHIKQEIQQQKVEEKPIDEDKKWSEQVYEEDLEQLLSSKNVCDSNSSTKSKKGDDEICNRDSDDDYNNQSYDDDQQSIRSEGGTLRLYSVENRIRNARVNYVSPKTMASQQQPVIAPSSSTRNGRHHPSDRIRGNPKTNSSANNYRNSNDSNYSHFNNTRNSFNRPQYDRPPRFSKFQQNYNQNQQSQNLWRDEAAVQSEKNFDRRKKTWGRGNGREQMIRRGGPLNDTPINRNQNNRIFSARLPLNNYQRENSFDRSSPDSNRNFHRGSSNNIRGGGNPRDNGHDYERYKRENYQNQNQNRRQSVESAGVEGRNRNHGRYGSQNSLASEKTRTYNRRPRFSSTNRSQEYSH